MSKHLDKSRQTADVCATSICTFLCVVDIGLSKQKSTLNEEVELGVKRCDCARPNENVIQREKFAEFQ